MLRGGSALARVCLCLVCLLGLQADELPTRDLQRQIEKLIGIAPLNDSGCRLYTPTQEHYRRYPSSSLTCFSEESQVLIEEWRIAGVAITRPYGLKQGLEVLADLIETESEDLSCESLPEQEATTFLRELKDILEMMNSPSPSP